MDELLEDLKQFCKNYKFDASQNFIQSPVGSGNPFYGQKHTEETKKHISYMQSTKVGELNQFYGKKHRPEVIAENRKKNIEILTKLKGKKVNQYDLNGNLIITHDSVRSAARSVNLKCYNEISKCCRGIKENYCGYLWKYT
jgi:group I intron endonuclease